MKQLETDILAELMRGKCECLTQIHTIGQRQLELIEQGEMTSLIELLAEKQRFLVRLRQIERDLSPFRHQDAETRRWRTPEDRRHCAEDLQRCETLLGEIILQEKRGERSLTRRRDQAAEQLQGAHLAQCARGAYNADAKETINQLDLHSET